jgi:hypothetical protein
MTEKMMFQFVILLMMAILFGALDQTAAAEREVPKFDINAACRGSGDVQTSARCMQDEQAARDQLAKLWPQFKQSDASRCIQIVNTGGAANYTELLSCLQAANIEEKTPTDPFGRMPSIAK